jgi:hypothetical protein
MRRADINQTNSRQHNSRRHNSNQVSPNQSNITLHIEHLILDGLPLSRNQGFDVQQALETELTRLLETGGLREGFNSTQEVPGIRSSMNHSQHPNQIGQNVARAVYTQLGRDEVSE